MQGLMAFLLFIIATAVAPQAMLNICRFIEAVFKVVFSVVGFAAVVGFWWWMIIK